MAGAALLRRGRAAPRGHALAALEAPLHVPAAEGHVQQRLQGHLLGGVGDEVLEFLGLKDEYSESALEEALIRHLEHFLLEYVEKGILPRNPFQTIDREGVGKLMRTGVELGRKTRPGMSIGICGEHGGDPSSIEFCHMAGLNYVSCSPFRVPIARLAAAHAALKHSGETMLEDK